MTEHRDRIPAEVRAVEEDGKRYVDLQAIVPGVVDDYGSLWMADTFDAHAAERLPILCWSHEWREPLGPCRDYAATPNGPRIRFEFSDLEAVPMAKRAWTQVSDGTITDCSVGFSNAKRRDPTDEEIDQYPGIAEVIFEAELDEVSLVVRGAVPGAKVLAFRSEERRRALARQLADGEITPEQYRAGLAFDGDVTDAEQIVDEMLDVDAILAKYEARKAEMQREEAERREAQATAAADQERAEAWARECAYKRAVERDRIAALTGVTWVRVDPDDPAWGAYRVTRHFPYIACRAV